MSSRPQVRILRRVRLRFCRDSDVVKKRRLRRRKAHSRRSLPRVPSDSTNPSIVHGGDDGASGVAGSAGSADTPSEAGVGPLVAAAQSPTATLRALLNARPGMADAWADDRASAVEDGGSVAGQDGEPAQENGGGVAVEDGEVEEMEEGEEEEGGDVMGAMMPGSSSEPLEGDFDAAFEAHRASYDGGSPTLRPSTLSPWSLPCVLGVGGGPACSGACVPTAVCARALPCIPSAPHRLTRCPHRVQCALWASTLECGGEGE
jgi:hypothetical protein